MTEKIAFAEDERTEIRAKAEERSTQGTEHRLSLHPYEEKEAKTLNRVGNHIAGELSERAVSKWLTSKGVAHRRPTSLKQELESKLPDITTCTHKLKLDVKSTYAPNNFKADAGQVDANGSDAIVWCKACRGGYTLNFDEFVPESAEIAGWNLLRDMKDGDLVDNTYVVTNAKVRKLDTLLDWLKSGTSP